MKTRTSLFTLLIGMTLGVTLYGQSQEPPVRVAFSDPNRIGTVKVSLVHGGVTIKGYNGREVVIETSSRVNRTSTSDKNAQGMRRLTNFGAGLTVEEENNIMSISSSRSSNSVDLTIQVPTRTNLILRAVNNGDIVVEQVQGDMEINNSNGRVTLTGVGGSAIVTAHNGRIVASFTQVTAQKPMSFASYNGTIDVTLPPDVKANLKMRTDNGDVYSDFDVTLRPNTTTQVEDTRNRGGRYRLRLDRSMQGTVNGGGPEFEFTSYNGSIYLRKASGR